MKPVVGRILHVAFFSWPYGHTVGALALNYCKTCRRHLNGAVSCPGCGATGLELSNVQDGRSTVWMPPVSGLGRAKSHARLPIPDSDPYEGDLVGGPAAAGRGGRHGDKPRPSVVSDAGGAHGGGGQPSRAQAAQDARRDRAARRAEKRRGVGLMLTGGFAGVAVVAFLVFGNATGGGDGTSAGNVVAESSASAGDSTSAGALPATVSASASRSLAVATSASASATHTASASASPSKSPTPTEATTSAAAGESTSAAATTATTTTAASSPTTASSSPAASPTPSSTKSSCWWIFC